MRHIEERARTFRWVIFGGPKVSEHLQAKGFADRLHLVTTTHIQATKAGRKLDAAYSPRDEMDLLVHNYQFVKDTFNNPAIATNPHDFGGALC